MVRPLVVKVKKYTVDVVIAFKSPIDFFFANVFSAMVGTGAQ